MRLADSEANGIGQDKTSILVRRRHVSRLALAGVKNQEIADELGVDIAAVRSDLTHLSKQWKREAKRSTDKLIREQLGRLSTLEAEYWEAWEASKKPTTKTSKQTKKSTKNGDETTAKVDTTTTSGDPRFLEGVHKCIEQRRKLLGLDAPEKTESIIKIDSDDEGL